MMMLLSYLPFATGAVASFILGMLWYSPVLFGKQWQRLTSTKNMGKMNFSMMAPLFLTSILSAFLMSYVLGSLLMALGVTDPMVGMQVGFLGWLGFVAPTSLVNAVYGKKSMKLYAIDNGYHLVSLMLMGLFYTLIAR